MATYMGQFRTNYFKVKDEAAFEAWLKLWSTEDHLQLFRGEGGMLGFGAYDGVPGRRSLKPGEQPDVEGEADKEADLYEELQQHLAHGEVAVLVESGHEKLSYVGGAAACIPAHGKITYIDPVRRALRLAARIAGRAVSGPQC